jgi:hypothetical protein
MYSHIEMNVEYLPGKTFSPFHPFTGFVINFNVMTTAHRDGMDSAGCVVMVIGSEDLVGGELVLFEPGIVLELRNGDIVAFQSKKITHFNLHYVGKRASFVLHSDVTGEGFKKDGNGWNKNDYFCFLDVIGLDS